MSDGKLCNFATEKYAYENPHSEYEGNFHIEKMGVTYPDERYTVDREHYGCGFYRRSFVFEYVLSGEGYIADAHEVYKVKAGDFYMFPCNHIHRCYCNSENPYSKIWITVGGHMMEELLQLYDLQSGLAIKQIPCRKTFEQIHAECLRIGKENKREVYRNVFKLLVELLDQLMGNAVCDMPAPPPYKIRDFIDANIQADICLDDIVNKFFFSKSYIINCFKSEFGFSPKQYIIQKKIALAKEMLRETNMSIKSIAEMLHFADSHHFSNTFKKHTGYVPVEFRTKAGL